MSNIYSRQAFKHYQAMCLTDRHQQGTGAYTITMSGLNHPQGLLTMPILCSIIMEEWQQLPTRFAGVKADVLMILPDHLHGILWNNEQVESPKKLSNIIGAYKSLVVVTWIKHLKVTGENYPGKIWQGSFYDHVIQNEQDLQKQRAYMQVDAERKVKPMTGRHVCKYASCGHIPFPPQ